MSDNNRPLVRRGERVFFKPEWRDTGDENRVFIADDDEPERKSDFFGHTWEPYIGILELPASLSFPVVTRTTAQTHMIERSEPYVRAASPAELAEKMKADILQDVANGDVPPTVASFSDLHEYTDANLYGGTEKLLDAVTAQLPDTEAGHTTALNAVTDLMHRAVNIVDAWIKNGGLRQETVAA